MFEEELQNSHLFFTLVVLLHERVDYFLQFVWFDERLCVLLNPFWYGGNKSCMHHKTDLLHVWKCLTRTRNHWNSWLIFKRVNIAKVNACLYSDSLTVYSCLHWMLLCADYQRHIMGMWFSCCHTGDVLEHDIANFETLEETERKKKKQPDMNKNNYINFIYITCLKTVLKWLYK